MFRKIDRQEKFRNLFHFINFPIIADIKKCSNWARCQDGDEEQSE